MDRPDTTLKNHLAITVSCSSFVSCTSGQNIRYVSTLLLALRQDRRVVVCSDDGRQTSVQWRSACGWSECWGTPVEGESRPAGRYIICLPGGGGRELGLVWVYCHQTWGSWVVGNYISVQKWYAMGYWPCDCRDRA